MVTQSFLWGGQKKSVYVEFKNHLIGTFYKCQIDVKLTTFCLRAIPPKNLLSNFDLEDVKSTVKISKMLISSQIVSIVLIRIYHEPHRSSSQTNMKAVRLRLSQSASRNVCAKAHLGYFL